MNLTECIKTIRAIIESVQDVLSRHVIEHRCENKDCVVKAQLLGELRAYSACSGFLFLVEVSK